MNIKTLIENDKVSASVIVERLTSGRVPIPGEHFIALEDFQGIPKGTKFVIDDVEAEENSPMRKLSVTTEEGQSLMFSVSQDDIDLMTQNLFAK